MYRNDGKGGSKQTKDKTSDHLLAEYETPRETYLGREACESNKWISETNDGP